MSLPSPQLQHTEPNCGLCLAERKMCHVCAVVFGRVEEGLQIVKKLESLGSSSGKTRQPVVIADCGELPSRRQILTKLAAEKDERTNLKKDPMQVI